MNCASGSNEIEISHGRVFVASSLRLNRNGAVGFESPRFVALVTVKERVGFWEILFNVRLRV